MTVTVQRRGTPPPGADTVPGGNRQPTPTGAARMQNWYINNKGVRVRTEKPVPVDADDVRTAHLLHLCTSLVRKDGGFARCGHSEWLLAGVTRFCPDHGKTPLTPVKTAADRRDLARETARMFVAGRDGDGALQAGAAVPWAVLAAEAAAGIYAQAGDLPATHAAMSVPLLAGAGYVVARRTLTRRAIKRGRIEKGQKSGRRIVQIVNRSKRVGAVGAASGAWMAAAAATDPGTWLGRAAWVGMAVTWAVGSYPWWLSIERRRTRVKPAVAVVAPVEPVVAPPDPVALRAETTWRTRIGCSGGPLAGTHLEDFARLPACDAGGDRVRLPNWTAKVVADDPGSINMREERPNLLGRIAAAYGCTYGDVSFAADESDLSIAYLRVQPDNVLAETRMWQGPARSNDWRNGRSRVGRFDDGLAIIYRWWSKTGAIHDLISGCTGSGKSEVVAQLLLDSLHSGGLVLDWVGDPQGGQSYGALKDAVDWFARDKTEITFLLLAAVKEMYRRNDELSNANIKTWQPSKAMPLLCITLDEVQSYISDPIILDLVERLVGQGRKCGIKMRLITQIPAAYNLGDSTYIKEQLKAGQQFVFRSADDIAARSAVDGDCPIDPTLLPKKWSGSTCAPGETTAGLMFVLGIEGRDVYGRSDWTGDDMRVWLVDEDGVSTLSPARFGDAAVLESGPLWGDRKERIARALAQGRSDVDLLPGGKALELIQAAAVVSPVPAAVVEAMASMAPTRSATRARDVVLSAARSAADANGVVTRELIVAATPEMKDGTRNGALTDLVADGDLTRLRNGVYAVQPSGVH